MTGPSEGYPRNDAALHYAVGAIVAAALLFAATPRAHSADTAAATTIVTFTESAQRQMTRDRMTAELAVEASDSDPRRLQDRINRQMKAALDRANATAKITVATAGYAIYPVRPEKGPMHWEGREGLRLDSTDRTALLGLVGTLQAEGLVITNLTAEVSPAAERTAEEGLTAEALHRVAARARQIAATLDMRILRYKTLRIGNAGTGPLPVQPLMRAMAAAPAAAEPGTATVAVSVQAEVELAPQP